VGGAKSYQELEQEIVKLRDALRKEKLNKAEELLSHRLVYSSIILVIVFIFLSVKLEGESNAVQWLCFIAFFGVVLIVIGKIAVHYQSEKKNAERQEQ